MTFPNKNLRGRSASPLERDTKRRRGFLSSEGHNVNGKELFVSNLPYNLTWKELKDTINDIVGESPYVKLYNNEEGKPRGCGTIGFQTKESAKKALEKMQTYELKGRKIKVNEAFDEPRDEFGYLISSGALRKKDSERRRVDINDIANSRSSPSGSIETTRGEEYGLDPKFLNSIGITGSLTNRIWVSNLDDERVDERKLMEVFRLAGRVTMIQLSRTKEGKSKGHTIVEYNHPLEAVQAISMLNNSLLYGKKMYVRLDRIGDNSRNQFPNRLPDGLMNLGLGLGQNGTPLQNITERFSNRDTLRSTSRNDDRSDNNVSEELVKLLQSQKKALSTIGRHEKQMTSPLLRLNAADDMQNDQEGVATNKHFDKDQLMELIKKSTFSKEYNHRSASLDQMHPSKQYTSYSSGW